MPIHVPGTVSASPVVALARSLMSVPGEAEEARLVVDIDRERREERYAQIEAQVRQQRTMEAMLKARQEAEALAVAQMLDELKAKIENERMGELLDLAGRSRTPVEQDLRRALGFQTSLGDEENPGDSPSEEDTPATKMSRPKHSFSSLLEAGLVGMQDSPEGPLAEYYVEQNEPSAWDRGRRAGTFGGLGALVGGTLGVSAALLGGAAGQRLPRGALRNLSRALAHNKTRVGALGAGLGAVAGGLPGVLSDHPVTGAYDSATGEAAGPLTTYRAQGVMDELRPGRRRGNIAVAKTGPEEGVRYAVDLDDMVEEDPQLRGLLGKSSERKISWTPETSVGGTASQSHKDPPPEVDWPVSQGGPTGSISPMAHPESWTFSDFLLRGVGQARDTGAAEYEQSRYRPERLQWALSEGGGRGSEALIGPEIEQQARESLEGVGLYNLLGLRRGATSGWRAGSGRPSRESPMVGGSLSPEDTQGREAWDESFQRDLSLERRKRGLNDPAGATFRGDSGGIISKRSSGASKLSGAWDRIARGMGRRPPSLAPMIAGGTAGALGLGGLAAYMAPELLGEATGDIFGEESADLSQRVRDQLEEERFARSEGMASPWNLGSSTALRAHLEMEDRGGLARIPTSLGEAAALLSHGDDTLAPDAQLPSRYWKEFPYPWFNEQGGFHPLAPTLEGEKRELALERSRQGGPGLLSPQGGRNLP